MMCNDTLLLGCNCVCCYVLSAVEQPSFSEQTRPTEARYSTVYGGVFLTFTGGLMLALFLAIDAISLQAGIAYMKYNLNLHDHNPYRAATSGGGTVTETVDLRQINAANGVANMMPAAMFSIPQVHDNTNASFAGNMSQHFRPRQVVRPQVENGHNGKFVYKPPSSKPKVGIGLFKGI